MAKGLGSAATTVRDYLQKQNRPYSATDLHNNIKTIPKTQILKALQELADLNCVTQKTYGKQSVFVVNQQEIHVDQDELKKNMAEIELLSKTSIPDLKREVAETSARLQERMAYPTNEEADARYQQLEHDMAKNCDKLSSLRENPKPLLTREELVALDNLIQSREKMLKKRKRIFQDVINSMTEASDISPQALMDELGIDL